MISQKEFFELICARFKTKTEASVFIAKEFNISVDTVKKWIYGQVVIDILQLQRLIDIFDIDSHKLFKRQENTVNFKYIKLTSGSTENYKKYITSMANLLEKISHDENAQLLFKADDIPIFHLLPYRNLTYFRLYCFAYNIYDYTATFEEFLHLMQELEVQSAFDRIWQAYNQIESVEIWDEYVLATFLRDIRDMYSMNIFENKASAIKLLDEANEMIKKVWGMVGSGKKETGVNFDFYTKSTPTRMGGMFVKHNDQLSHLINLDMINSMYTDNVEYTSESFKMYESCLERSCSLGKGSKRERTLYFKKLKSELKTVRIDIEQE